MAGSGEPTIARKGLGPIVTLIDMTNCVEDWKTNLAFQAAICFEEDKGGTRTRRYVIWGSGVPSSYTGATAGSIYIDRTNGMYYVFDGSSWIVSPKVRAVGATAPTETSFIGDFAVYVSGETHRLYWNQGATTWKYTAGS